MAGQQDIAVGMLVVGADGQPVGAITAVTADAVEVGPVAIQRAAIDRVEGGALHLLVARSALAATPDVPGLPAVGGLAPDEGWDADGGGERLVLPLAEERLRVEVRAVELGEVELRRRVVTEERLVPVVARREELIILRREPGRPWPPGDAPGPGDEVTSLPLRGWEPVVAAEARVTREVTIERARVAEDGHVAATVRRERIAVAERHRTPPAAGGAPPPPLARHQGSGAEEWEALRQQIRAVAPDAAPDTEESAPVERLVLPLAEERVGIGGYETDLGEVRLVRRVIEEERTVAITVRREVVEVVRRDADGREIAYPLAPSGREQERTI